jgi:dTDP-4-amino-4,6-dideoxygalactose transaminase
MEVKLLDLGVQYNSIENEIDSAIKDVLIGTHFIMGPNVKKLEEEIAKFVGVDYGIGVGNGTDALMLCLRAIGIKPGDEVITTPFTFFASAETTSLFGGVPVFADIDPNTLCIDPAKIEEKITSKTKAIIPVHIFGQMCDMDPIMEIARKHNIPVIEDACQAIGAEYKGKKAGSIGDFGCFSFFPTKNLGCYGDGGMIVTNNKEYADHIKLLRVHGAREKYKHIEIGYNTRLDEIQAAILRVKFQYLNEYSENRYKKAHIYNELLKGLNVTVPFEDENCKHVYHQYVIKVKGRDELQKFLKENNIGTAIYYPIPVHMLPVYKDLGYKPGDLPVTEEVCQKVIALPMYPEIELEKQKYVAEKIKEFLEK